MKDQTRKISLGFTHEHFSSGVHICQIFNDDDERYEALMNFIVSGLTDGENTACFSEKETKESFSEFFEKKGISYNDVEKSGKFLLDKTKNVYFAGNKFHPERMLDLLQKFYENSNSNNSTGARVIGEMEPEIENIEGGNRLLEYESKVTLLQKKYPITAVCQYDARLFNGSTIMDVLKVHPLMIIRGAVVHNPFYITPEEYLSKKNN